jgi:hypothetical protein
VLPTKTLSTRTSINIVAWVVNTYGIFKNMFETFKSMFKKIEIFKV